MIVVAIRNTTLVYSQPISLVAVRVGDIICTKSIDCPGPNHEFPVVSADKHVFSWSQSSNPLPNAMVAKWAT